MTNCYPSKDSNETIIVFDIISESYHMNYKIDIDGTIIHGAHKTTSSKYTIAITTSENITVQGWKQLLQYMIESLFNEFLQTLISTTYLKMHYTISVYTNISQI